MKQSDIVQYFPIAWASNPDNGTFSAIPKDDPGDGSASLSKGFPIQTMTPLAAGGKPPRGDQFNGIFNMLSETARQREAGIIPPWSNDFAQAIGGYPATAHVTLLTNSIPDILISISDNNLDNPADPKQVNWVSIKQGLQTSGFYPFTNNPDLPMDGNRNTGIRWMGISDNGMLNVTYGGGKDISNYAYPGVPVGTPLPWPLEVPPVGFLLMLGQTFDKKMYPKLGNAYPQGWLPDMRGNYISGYDPTGNNDDRGRKLLSWQGDAIRKITGGLGDVGSNVWDTKPWGAFYTSAGPWGSGAGDSDGGHSAVTFDSSRSVPTAGKNRPSNWAFNFIVRAK